MIAWMSEFKRRNESMSVITSTTTPGAASDSQATRAQTGFGKDLGTFLKLLTTQLRNQDPTSPLDSNEFTQQIVSFTQVEQSINTNTNLEKLIALNETTQLNNAASYIGKTVQINGEDSTLSNGKATFTYSLTEKADESIVVISNKEGKVIYSGNGEKQAGTYHFIWDGRNNEGDLQPEGTYTIKVMALDNDGNEIEVKTTTTGVVNGAIFKRGVPLLEVDGQEVPLDKIIAVTASTVDPETSSSLNEST